MRSFSTKICQSNHCVNQCAHNSCRAQASSAARGMLMETVGRLGCLLWGKGSVSQTRRLLGWIELFLNPVFLGAEQAITVSSVCVAYDSPTNPTQCPESNNSRSPLFLYGCKEWDDGYFSCKRSSYISCSRLLTYCIMNNVCTVLSIMCSQAAQYDFHDWQYRPTPSWRTSNHK